MANVKSVQPKASWHRQNAFTNLREVLTFSQSITGDCSILADPDILSHRNRPNLSNSNDLQVYQLWSGQHGRMSFIGDLPFVRVWRKAEVDNPGLPVADLARLVARQMEWIS